MNVEQETPKSVVHFEEIEKLTRCRYIDSEIEYEVVYKESKKVEWLKSADPKLEKFKEKMCSPGSKLIFYQSIFCQPKKVTEGYMKRKQDVINVMNKSMD
jgi:hypothetical protein